MCVVYVKKAFAQASYLNKHVKIHKGKKVYAALHSKKKSHKNQYNALLTLFWKTQAKGK